MWPLRFRRTRRQAAVEDGNAQQSNERDAAFALVALPACKQPCPVVARDCDEWLSPKKVAVLTTDAPKRPGLSGWSASRKLVRIDPRKSASIR